HYRVLAAGFWFAVAAVLFVLRYGQPDIPYLQIPQTELSAGWVGVVLGVYNLAWWWSLRSAERQRQQLAEAAARRRARDEERNRQRERDPKFIFDEPSTQMGGEGMTKG